MWRGTQRGYAEGIGGAEGVHRGGMWRGYTEGVHRGGTQRGMWSGVCRGGTWRGYITEGYIGASLFDGGHIDLVGDNRKFEV